MPEYPKDPASKSLPDTETVRVETEIETRTSETGGKDTRKSSKRSSKNLVPIIMSFALFFSLGIIPLSAQIEVDVTLETTYTDNVFQLSEYDLQRWQDENPRLDYVNTSDDLTAAVSIDAAYPFYYQWWKFTPSVTGTFSQNVSNTDKQRRDAIVRFRVDRYYWNFTALYGYYPHILVRSYVDTDGSGELEQFSYARNLYRGDLNIKPLKGTTVQLHGRYEQLFYNQYWTEFDGNATTLGAGIRHAFPVFSVGGGYDFRTFDNTNADNEDSSYESNIYSGDLRLNPMPLDDDKPKGTTWYPALALSYEERYFQSADSWYGGRIDKIYRTDASLNFILKPDWNIKLDYSHTFRNVESPVSEVRRAREYGENQFSAAVEYSF